MLVQCRAKNDKHDCSHKFLVKSILVFDPSISMTLARLRVNTSSVLMLRLSKHYRKIFVKELMTRRTVKKPPDEVLQSFARKGIITLGCRSLCNGARIDAGLKFSCGCDKKEGISNSPTKKNKRPRQRQIDENICMGYKEPPHPPYCRFPSTVKNAFSASCLCCIFVGYHQSSRIAA